MAGNRNKKGLTLQSSFAPKVHKKYLGEPDDPHFVPDSPIITRQYFTEQEEGELRRCCALALAGVPHSDDVSDDPFKDIAAFISVPPPAPERTLAQLTKMENGRIRLPEVPSIPVGGDTATPSDSSKRDTLSRTDYSTPLTSAGATPGETARRFSDAVRNITGSKGAAKAEQRSKSREPRNKSSSRSRNQSQPRKSSDAGHQKQHERKKSTDKAKSTIRLVTDRSRSRERTKERDVQTQPSTQPAQAKNKRQSSKPADDAQPTQQASKPKKSSKNKQTKSSRPETRSSTVQPAADSKAAQPVLKSVFQVQPNSTSAQTKPFRYSQAELNKSLPCLPPVDPNPIKIKPLRDNSMIHMMNPGKPKRGNKQDPETKSMPPAKTVSPDLLLDLERHPDDDRRERRNRRAKTHSFPLEKVKLLESQQPPAEKRNRFKEYFFAVKSNNVVSTTTSSS